MHKPIMTLREIMDAEQPSGEAVRSSEIVVPHGWSVKPLFAWYDLWIGIFWDSRKRKLYILPLPCVGVVIEFPLRHNADISDGGGQ